MKLNLFVVALFSSVVLLCAGEVQAQPEGQPCDAEPTSQLIAYGDHVNPCDIGLVGESDLFRFQGTIGDVVIISVTDLAAFSGPECLLELFRPTPPGTLVTSIGNEVQCQMRTTLDQSGLFTMRVTELNNDQLMTYTVQLDRLSPSSPTAPSINPGDTIVGGRIDPLGDGNLFLFNGVNGDSVSLRLTDQEGFSGPETSLELIRPDGTLVVADTDEVTAIIDRQLDQTGVFTVRVSEVNNDQVMTYNLEYQCIFGSCLSLYKPTDVAVDFGSTVGLWVLKPGENWAPVHSLSPVAMAAGDLDGNGVGDLVLNFGPDHGVYAWMNHATWMFLHSFGPSHMVTGDVNNNGRDELVVVFPGFGVWRWESGWSSLHGLDAIHLAVGQVDGLDGDDLIVDFSGHGLYILFNNSTWTPLHGLDATSLVTADLDGNGRHEVVIGFSGWGLWVYRYPATWTSLHPFSAAHIAAGNIDGNARADLVIDFGPSYGLWTYRNDTSWVLLHGTSAEDLVLVDRDRSGRDEIVIDFGPTWGLWQRTNDNTWSPLHGLSPEDIAAGRFH